MHKAVRHWLAADEAGVVTKDVKAQSLRRSGIGFIVAALPRVKVHMSAQCTSNKSYVMPAMLRLDYGCDGHCSG